MSLIAVRSFFGSLVAGWRNAQVESQRTGIGHADLEVEGVRDMQRGRMQALEKQGEGQETAEGFEPGGRLRPGAQSRRATGQRPVNED